MNNSLIIKQIRSNLIKQLVLPVFLLIIFAAVLMITPKDNAFNPRPLNYRSRFENFYNRDLPHVTLSVPLLSYSGLDYVVDGRIKGHYYYSLSDSFCQFYLFPSEMGRVPASELTMKNFRGQLNRLDDIEYRSIVNNMAENLNWTSTSLQNMTAPYVVSTLSHSFYLTLFFFTILYGGVGLFLTDILYKSAYLWKPFHSPALRYLGPLKTRQLLFGKAESELKYASTLKSGKMYLTPSFLAIFQYTTNIIIPLNSILNFYFYGRKKPFSGRKPKFYYTFAVVTKDGHTYRITRSNNKSLELLVSSLNRQLSASQYTNKIKLKQQLPI